MRLSTSANHSVSTHRLASQVRSLLLPGATAPSSPHLAEVDLQLASHADRALEPVDVHLNPFPRPHGHRAPETRRTPPFVEHSASTVHAAA